MDYRPIVSVIVPTYNRSEFTCKAVASVLSQTFSDYELIVVDDGSSEDNSKVQDLLQEPRRHFFYLDHRGVAAARNFGARNALGRWLAFLDSDDVWCPDKLSEQLAYLAQRPEMLICQTQEEWIRNGRRVNPKQRHQQPDGDAFERSLELCCVSPSSVMLDRALYEKIGGFDERLPVCEDYDLWLRIAACYPIGLVPKQLIRKLGGHPDQLSKSVPALDRFRVFSMVKLLGKQKLSDAQRRAVFCALEKKLAPLVAGCLKRGNAQLLDSYTKLVEEVRLLLASDSAEFAPESFVAYEDDLLRSLINEEIC